MARIPKTTTTTSAPQEAGSAPPSSTQTFDPDRLYRVTVSRVVSAGGLRITPKHGATLTGATAETIADAIVSAEPA